MKYKFLLRYYHVKYLIKSKFADLLLKVAKVIFHIADYNYKTGYRIINKASSISNNAFVTSSREYDMFNKELDLQIDKYKILEDLLDTADAEKVLGDVDIKNAVDKFNDEFPKYYPNKLDDILYLPPLVDRCEPLDDCDASIDA